MKRIIALILIISFILSGCNNILKNTNNSSEQNPSQIINERDEVVVDFDSLNDDNLLTYVENEIYAYLVDTLDPEMYFVEEISTKYVSKEYLDEIEYNSKENIFFGYSLTDLDAEFQGTKYIFNLGENGQTTVEELVVIKDDTYDKIIKNVAIGSGVIFISATVAIITKNPASAVTAGKTVKMIFTASSMGVKAGTLFALQSAGISGTIATIMEAIRTNDMSKAYKAGLLEASEGFKIGAILGTVKGIVNGIRIVQNTRYFPNDSKQALIYKDGVEFTKASNGKSYPRFEKWAKATAKFDTPNLEAAMNRSGLSGNYYWDVKLANVQCGLSETPAGYVWHHVEDMKTMILIPQDLHSLAMGGMRHDGGASLIRAFLGI